MGAASQPHLLGIMATAKRYVALIAANLVLCPFLDREAIRVDPQVHRRLASARADRLELDQVVGDGEQRGASREELRLEIGSQPIGEDRYGELVAHRGELKDLCSGEPLGLVDQDAVDRRLRLLDRDLL